MSANVRGNSVGPVPESVQVPGAAPWFAAVLSWLTQIARVLNLLLQGKVNAATTITLASSATSTTLTDDRIGPNSFIGLTPTTSSATALDIQPYVSARSSGSATISHGSSTASDLTFLVAILG